MDDVYKAAIEFATDPATIQCECADCDWKGTADKLKPIGDCCLTPGDASPAGRCPECDTLAYVIGPRFEVLTQMHGGEWENVWNEAAEGEEPQLQTFPTFEAAHLALMQHFYDLQEADMGFGVGEYKIAAVKG